MEKRVLLAVVLSFVVLYGYQALFPPPVTPTPETSPTAASPPADAGQSEAPAVAAPGQPPAAAAVPAETPDVLEAAALVADAAARDIVVDSPQVRAVFSSRGATLTSWVLKRYLDSDGQPLDLVPQSVRGALKPFSLTVDDARISSRLGTALYKPSADALTVGTTPATLSFEYSSADGLTVRKTFGFDPAHPYLLSFASTVASGGEVLVPTVHFGPALGTGITESTGTYNPPPQPIYYLDGSVTRVKASKIQDRPNLTGTFNFVGVDDHYFLTAAIPDQPMHVEYEPVAVPVEGTKNGAHFVAWSTKATAAPGEVRYFLGPKDFDVLKAVDTDLTRTIDFGKFSWLVVPLLQALKWVNGYVGNYGWSIIVLTILINLVMFPLRHKSVVSMRRMQEIQPEQKAIQERYAKLKATDPARQKMNVELMNLYRERGVNPASGCVPMLLTFPVLFAFYSMLSVAIELRGAPFVGWIKDLSAHDPLFITPVIMGATMLLQQRMTPTTGDPTQQKVMMLMPLVFMFMFVWAPSGLVLYWTVSNMWAIGQQALTNRIIGPTPQRSIRPPAERKLKNAGTGRTAQASKEGK
jgi:YidC/Oxa1 family membrane protein insertase